MNCEQVKVWKDTVALDFKEVTWHSAEETEENLTL
jgi:hypothetical protein